jgi:hypothetical protein
MMEVQQYYKQQHMWQFKNGFQVLLDQGLIIVWYGEVTERSRMDHEDDSAQGFMFFLVQYSSPTLSAYIFRPKCLLLSKVIS